MRRLLLLRPDPGLSATAARARALGLEVIECPLFHIEPVAWEIPNPVAYDALLLTSANAVRQAGVGLDALKSLPVHAVGASTAEAATAAGFDIASIGDGNAAELVATLPDTLRLLHLAGEDRQMVDGRLIDTRTVYRSAVIDRAKLPQLEGLVVAVHSPRAGALLAKLADTRDRTVVAAISQAAAQAAGSGWERVEIARKPNDPSLLALAAMLCHTSPPR